MLHRLSNTSLVIIGVVLWLGGAAVGWLSYGTAAGRIRREMIESAQRFAAAFDPAEVRRLTGDGEGPGIAGHARVKQQLVRLHAATPRLRFLYIVRFLPETGKAIYLAESAAARGTEEAVAGEDFPLGAESSSLQRVIRTGLPAVEGPARDDYGTWLTAYAVIAESPSPNSAVTRKEILGVDLDAADWRRDLWSAALWSAGAVWVGFGLPLFGLVVVRRQREQREAIRNLTEAMEQSHSALMVVDLSSHIEYANRGLCQQIGYSRRELIGRSWRDFQIADTSPERFAELTSTVRAGKSWEGEWINRRKDGTIYPVRGVITPVKNRSGVLSCFVAVFDDMTEIKRQETELREARDLAQAGDRAKGQFLATMSHEVRTPLNGIIGFTNLLLGTPLNAEQRECVETIRTSGEALIQLTTAILDYARIESGKLKLDLLPWDPRECVEDALDLFAASAAQKKIELLHAFAPDLPAAITTDGGRLRQVLINLISNAVKFTDTGEIEVTIAVAPEAGGPSTENRELKSAAEAIDRPPSAVGCSLTFRVRDTGLGIGEEERAQLFRPFTQLDGSLTRKYGGTGLGLAICKSLVQQLGGEISCTSARGRGSTFSFTLRAPVATPAVPPPDLSQVRVALVAAPGALRRELVRQLAAWRAPVLERDQLAALDGGGWDLAVVEVTDALATALTAPGAPPPSGHAPRSIGLVPMTLTTVARESLRPHFCLLLNKPAHRAALLAAVSGQSPLAPPLTTSANPFRYSVLVVEDNAVNQRFMQRALSRLGCTWRTMENGREALEELTRAASNYDLVLLDIHMPEVDGITALRRIRAGEAGSSARALWIVIVTADARAEQRAAALAAGANEFLAKPLQLSELEEALRRFRAARATVR